MSTSNETKRMPQLSVAVIARDAEQTIGQTLASVKSIADEMIVLDTGSTDQTVEIAKQQGATVYSQAWQDSFANARNQCLEKVSGNWVLWLDAEEYLQPEDTAALLEFIHTKADPSQVYMMIVQIPSIDGQVGNTEQIGCVRLHPNMPNLHFVGRVREKLMPKVPHADLEIDGIPWRILRCSETRSAKRQNEKATRDIILAELEIKEHGKNSRMLNTLAIAQSTLGQFPQAIETFNESISLTEPGSVEMLEAYYGMLTASDYDETSRENRLSICSKALESFPLDTQLLVALGTYLQAKNRLDLACRSFQLAHQHGQINPEAWHLAEIPAIAASCCSVSYQLEGKDDQAQEVLESTLGNYPEMHGLRRRLIELHIKQGRKEVALKQLDLLPGDIPNIEALRIAIRGACLMAKEQWTSAISYLNTAYEAGCRDEICLRGLAVSLLSTGQVEPAEKYVQQWIELLPENEEAKAYQEVINQYRQPEIGVADSSTAETTSEDVITSQNDLAPHTSDTNDKQTIRRIDQVTTGAETSLPKTHEGQSFTTSTETISEPPASTSS